MGHGDVYCHVQLPWFLSPDKNHPHLGQCTWPASGPVAPRWWDVDPWAFQCEPRGVFIATYGGQNSLKSTLGVPGVPAPEPWGQAWSCGHSRRPGVEIGDPVKYGIWNILTYHEIWWNTMEIWKILKYDDIIYMDGLYITKSIYLCDPIISYMSIRSKYCWFHALFVGLGSTASIGSTPASSCGPSSIGRLCSASWSLKMDHRNSGCTHWKWWICPWWCKRLPKAIPESYTRFPKQLWWQPQPPLGIPQLFVQVIHALLSMGYTQLLGCRLPIPIPRLVAIPSLVDGCIVGPMVGFLSGSGCLPTVLSFDYPSI